jgi:hypothetical protein
MASPRRADGPRLAALSLYAPRPSSPPCSRRWRVGGWPAEVLVWTDEQYRGMRPADRPADAQRYEHGGVWVALRMA